MTQRLAKINSVLHKDIALYVESKISSNQYIVSVSYVLATPDLLKARVGIVTFPQNDKFIKEAITKLKINISDLQLSLARKHKLKNIPTLLFEKAKDNEETNKIDELLQVISNE
jgi:ribosome-binding factor A